MGNERKRKAAGRLSLSDDDDEERLFVRHNKDRRSYLLKEDDHVSLSLRHELRPPKLPDNLSWGKKPKLLATTTDDANRLISTTPASSSLNRFANDGSFMMNLLLDVHKKSESAEKKEKKKNNINLAARRVLMTTQQERCLFCFENPNRPNKHLVVSIANFTYLTLPQQKPIVPGHCCILPLQHGEAGAGTRNVEDHVWEEIRNFKKCLIRMFAEQGKEVVFLETVTMMGGSSVHQQQRRRGRRHCLLECIPLPRDIAKQAPLYFKKAIDEAEDEWSQHNAKRLIETTTTSARKQGGLRGSIPKDFPYFHVEFGLDRGFVHVIDDESRFSSGGSFGLNVIRGMMELPEEDMYRRRRRHDTVQGQKVAVAEFVRDWEPFDWTKQLHC